MRHIYRAVYFYFYCISSTPDHQTSDPRAWGPLLQGTAIPSILHRKKRRQKRAFLFKNQHSVAAPGFKSPTWRSSVLSGWHQASTWAFWLV